MTREEKISHLKDILSEINENDDAVCYLTSEDNELIESAIEALERESQTFEWCTDCREYDQEKHCCHRWSKVIRNTVEEIKKPCEDAISRGDALKALDYDVKSFEFKSGVGRHMSEIANLLNTIYEIQVNNIKALPSVIPQEAKTGHWISYWDEEARCYVYKCPECGNKQPFDTKCCWECGTRLIVTQESEKSNGTH